MANDGDEPATLWDIHADFLVRQEGLSLSNARDVVIIDWLRNGELKALKELLLAGHRPGISVRIFLAKMLSDEPDATFTVPSIGTYPVPFQLVAKRRSGSSGAPDKPEVFIRDYLIALNMAKLMAEEGMNKTDAARYLVNAAKETGRAIELRTVLNAHAKIFGNQSQD